MSNKTQLQTNNSALDALITRVNAAKNTAASLPETGGSGGSVETCTVEFIIGDSDVTDEGGPVVILTVVENGVLKPRETLLMMNGATVDNVLCGSTIYVVEPSYTGKSIVTSDNITNVGKAYVVYAPLEYICSAPTEAGTTGTITLY